MRTTLKRGMRRAASANGNGSGNGRAILPPVARTAMRRYTAPVPPRRSGWSTLLWFFRWFGFALLIVVAGLGGGAYLYEHETTSALQAHSVNVKRARTQLNQTVPPPSQPAIALLIGYDKRAGADAALNGGSRSDTIMLARADPGKKVVSLLSFPRDLVVPISCDHGPIGVTDRINSAWSRCGASGTVATVAALTGIRPDYLITVDFHGFKLLVNKLHGVYMDVDHRYLNTHGGPGGYAQINLEPGYQRLNGGQALSFVRFRHTDSDLYRLARQQLFLSALRERIASKSIFAIPKIIGAMKGNMEIENGAGSALSTDTVLSFLQFAHGLSAGHIFRDKFENLQPYGPGGAEVWASQSSIQSAVAEFESPDVQASAKANAAALGIKHKAKKPKLRPSEISTLVLNGTARIGLAANTSYSLAKAGYHTVALANGRAANAPSQGYTQTQVYFSPAQPRAHEAAQELEALFPNAVIGPYPAEMRAYARDAGNPLTIVVLGSTFDGTLKGAAPPPPDTTPKHTPPEVAANPGLTLTGIRDVRPRLSFRPMVPHTIESHSSLAELSPVRAYKPAAGHTGLRLTFVLNTGNEYWGIEETDWLDAPLLASPSEARTIGGRRFDFYYSGSHLHVVALRTPKAVYWVTNTLLDKLSNETMIAIARGLQPLGPARK